MTAHRSNGTQHCHPTFEPVAPISKAIGLLLVFATLFAALPQIVLLCRLKSSVGLSVLTPILTLSYGMMNLCATITVKWPSLQSCGDAGGAQCIIQLLDALQMLVANTGLAAIVLLAVAFPPNDSRRLRALAIFSIFSVVLLVIFTSVLSAYRPCTSTALDFARFLSGAAGVTVCFAFAPQLVASWRARGRGSISYAYYTIQGGGCCLVACFAIFSLHDPWPVYGPNVVAGLFQLLILALGAYFKCSDSASGMWGSGWRNRRWWPTRTSPILTPSRDALLDVPALSHSADQG